MPLFAVTVGTSVSPVKITCFSQALGVQVQVGRRAAPTRIEVLRPDRSVRHYTDGTSTPARRMASSAVAPSSGCRFTARMPSGTSVTRIPASTPVDGAVFYAVVGRQSHDVEVAHAVAPQQVASSVPSASRA